MRTMHAAAKTLELGQPAEQWPVLGLGTWRLGESARTADHEVSLIRKAVEIGYRLFDTAEMYGEGGAEQVLGQGLAYALRERGVEREQLRVVSKAYPQHGDVAGLRRACDASRRRLQLDTIDLYLLHWRGDIPLAQTVRGFEQLQQHGWIRHWGVSNFDTNDLDELLTVPGAAACAANQVYYSLSERGVEFDLLPRMQQQGLPLMAYCPIDGGRITQHARLAKIAATVNLTAAQLALAWLLRQGGVIAIPKAGREAHLLENWQSQATAIPDEAWSALEAMFPRPTRKRGLAMR
jgi:diketogulonate reductase-like aldo/keto reductase